MSRVRIGVDIGGTFTDLVLLDEGSGELTVVKIPTSPANPAEALIEAVRRALDRAHATPDAVALLIHGTTLVTNAVLEGTLPRAALVTTRGFRDVLEIGRHFRPDMYDLFQDKPAPLIPRDLRFEVRERTGPAGEVLERLDLGSAEAAVAAVRSAGVEAIAIAFLHSYANPANELAMKAWLSEAVPGAFVATSAEVCREIREYERTSTVALNAAAMPLAARAFEVLRRHVGSVTPKAQILLMQSSGGSMPLEAATGAPAHLVYSGPAAGVLAARHAGRITGRENVLGFDMGGTSTDISLIHRGQPRMTTEGGIGGHPVRVPMLDIHTIGAGGGSIAWLDPDGGLHVGPRSAGADPGPASYGRGGQEPTVTDANLLLGRLSAGAFLGGEMRLDRAAAEAAIARQVGRPLGLSLERAAYGIVRIANANMERAIRVSSAERGYDPRDFTLVAFGGAGPLHAAALARALGFPQVLVPEVPGAFSALGLLVADIRHDFARSRLVRADALSPADLGALFDELEALGLAQLREDGLAEAEMALLRSADLRYVGQAYEVNVPVASGPVSARTLAEVVGRFHEEHQRMFAHAAPHEPVEFVSVRVAAVGRIPAPSARRVPAPAGVAPPVPRERRPVYFEEGDGFLECPVYERGALAAGMFVSGPAIVEQMDSTTLVHPGQRFRVDEFRHLIIERAA